MKDIHIHNTDSLLDHIDKIHTTELGTGRIKKI